MRTVIVHINFHVVDDQWGLCMCYSNANEYNGYIDNAVLQGFVMHWTNRKAILNQAISNVYIRRHGNDIVMVTAKRLRLGNCLFQANGLSNCPLCQPIGGGSLFKEQ